MPCGGLQRRLDPARLHRQRTGRLVRHEHRDFIDELLENLHRRLAIPQNGQLVQDQRMPND
jgi:hypothetical protein